MYRKLSLMLLAIALSAGTIRAQEQEPPADQGGNEAAAPAGGELEETVSGLNDRVGVLEGEVDKLKSLKISGYVQSEWQHYDQTTDVGKRALYSDATKNLFTIRRGRIKFQYKFGDLMSMTIQPDFTERGVAMKDAFLTWNILRNDELTFDFGLFNRPNYEVETSSSVRESPERAQVVRAFYPDERDVGIMFSARRELFENFDPKIQLGLFNGPGVVKETDAYKDFIGRLVLPLPLGNDLPIHIDLGGSIYYGGVPQLGDSIVKAVGGKMVTVANDATGSMRGMGNKKNFNVETQIYLDLLPFGGTMLKGEFLTGTRPTAAVAATAPTVGTTKDSTGKDVVKITPGAAAKPLTLRNQSGFYAYFVQNVDTWLQVVVKYDMFDRNTDLSGSDAKSFDDAASSVLGFGVNLFYENLRITLFYEHPTFAAGENVLRDKTGTVLDDTDVKDDKGTIRFQFKF